MIQTSYVSLVTNNCHLSITERILFYSTIFILEFVVYVIVNSTSACIFLFFIFCFRIELEASKATSLELEKTVSSERRSLENARKDQQRVMDDILSAKRVYDEYYKKASELLPVLQAHKQV